MVAVGAAKAMKTLASNDLFTGISPPFSFR
jgi:hypothetical protein